MAFVKLQLGLSNKDEVGSEWPVTSVVLRSRHKKADGRWSRRLLSLLNSSVADYSAFGRMTASMT